MYSSFLKYQGIVFAGLVLGVLSGCGGGSASSSPTSTDAKMNVRLVDGPISGYQAISVHIKSVEISSSGSGWITLGTPDKTVNLLSLTGGVSESLVAGAGLPAGHYDQMRLILGDGNTVKLSDGTTQDLKVPSGLQTGIKLNVNFDVAAGTTKDVFIDFDAGNSIQVVKAGASGQFILRPEVQAFDMVVTGSIQGNFTANGSALAGATVFAETVDASGNATIVRSVQTDASGNYSLDLLPVGTTYYVVSLPVSGSTTYDAKASGAIALSTSAPTASFSTSFTADLVTGSVSGTVTPTAGDTAKDTVYLMASFGSNHLIVARTTATIDTTGGVSTESYAFANVPVGPYFVRDVRATLNADGTTSVSVSTLATATISVGLNTLVNINM